MIASRPVVAALAAVSSILSACGAGDDGASTGSDAGVTVFAAASLTAAFTDIGDAFAAVHPEWPVAFSFAGSSELVTQIAQGAPADVFASADLPTMATLADTGQQGSEPAVFATNTLEIIVAPGNPLAIDGLADLANDGVIVVTCAPEVPCGAYASQVFAGAGVSVTPKSLEENVKAVATKVVLGEADAGIVYATDVVAAGPDAAGVAIPADVNVTAEYPIAVTKEAPSPDGARAFIDFVLSDDGREILAAHGFGPP